MVSLLQYLRTDSKRGRTRLLSVIILLFLLWLMDSLLNYRPAVSDLTSLTVGNDLTNSTAHSEERDCKDFKKIQTLPLKHECLLNYIREHHLYPPSNEDYKLTRMSVEFPSEHMLEIRELLGNKSNGFFIECGANDGEFLSNTLALELRKNWSGLLVEAHPKYGRELLKLNRKAWFSDVCLSPYNNVTEIDFYESATEDSRWWRRGIGKLVMRDDLHKKKDHLKFRVYGTVPCFPLVSLLAALNVTHVDFFSLDVEGVELKVLKTLPYDESLTIDFIELEHRHVPEGKDAVKTFMLSKGYKLILEKEYDFMFKRL